jgi:hypothetical protein
VAEKARIVERLVCDGCGTVSDEHAYSWEAVLGIGPYNSTTVVVLCPDCAEDAELEATGD